MAETKGIWHNVPPVVKGVIYLVIAGGAVYGGYEIDQAIKRRKAAKGGRDEVKDIKKDLENLNSDPAMRQTLSASTVSAMANNMFAAMDGYGTDTTALVKNLLQLKRQADWLAVRKAFGIRTISSGKYNPTPDFTGTLDAALTDEIGITDAPILNNLNAYFKARKIDLVL